MMLTVGQLAEVTGGALLCGDPACEAGPLRTDTRILRPGDVFVALRGANFDGDEFIAQALGMGAGGVICSRDVTLESVGGNAFVLQVPDTTVALADVARAWRRRINPVVAAITGSSGKTTTKEMAAHLCRESLSILATEGNRNNHIGLPLTLLRLRPDHACAIVEMGMNHSGELAALAGVAEPDLGVITVVGDAHIGNFADGQDGVIAAKAELPANMRRNGTAILNADCHNTRALRTRYTMPNSVFTFGLAEDADIRANNIRACEPFGYDFDLHLFEYRVRTHLSVFGRYQIHNALAAAAVAVMLGVDPHLIADRLASFRAPDMRSCVTRIGGIDIVEDCYNAAPSATVEALRSFAEWKPDARHFVLLGEMKELGGLAEPCHRRVGRAAAAGAFDMIVCAGPGASWIADEARLHNARAIHFEKVDDAAAFLCDALDEGDALLIKGSRAVRLERAIDCLRACHESREGSPRL